MFARCIALPTVPKVAQQMVAATLRTIFAQHDLATPDRSLARGFPFAADIEYLAAPRRSI